MKRKPSNVVFLVLAAYVSLYIASRSSHILYHQLWWNGSSEFKSVMHYHEIRNNEQIGAANVAHAVFNPLCWLESACYNSKDLKYRKGEEIEDYIAGNKKIPNQWYENIEN